jgi:hypothetical protein
MTASAHLPLDFLSASANRHAGVIRYPIPDPAISECDWRRDLLASLADAALERLMVVDAAEPDYCARRIPCTIPDCAILEDGVLLSGKEICPALLSKVQLHAI